MDFSHHSPGWFYRKTSELQDALSKREATLQLLEKDLPSTIFKKSLAMDKESLQQYWQKVLEDNRKQEERNKTLLQKLGKVEQHVAVLSHKTAALNALREQYSSMMKILTSMSVEPVSRLMAPVPSSTDFVSRNMDRSHQRNAFQESQNNSSVYNNHSNVDNNPHSAILVRHVAIQTDPAICPKCGCNAIDRNNQVTRDQLFRRVQSVSDLLGMSGLPKPPTPYPRMSTFSSMSSLSSQNIFASNLSETRKQAPELGHSRNFSFESLDFLSPIHSPKSVRRNDIPEMDQSILNEVLSALPRNTENPVLDPIKTHSENHTETKNVNISAFGHYLQSAFQPKEPNYSKDDVASKLIANREKENLTVASSTCISNVKNTEAERNSENSIKTIEKEHPISAEHVDQHQNDILRQMSNKNPNESIEKDGLLSSEDVTHKNVPESSKPEHDSSLQKRSLPKVDDITSSGTNKEVVNRETAHVDNEVHKEEAFPNGKPVLHAPDIRNPEKHSEEVKAKMSPTSQKNDSRPEGSPKRNISESNGLHVETPGNIDEHKSERKNSSDHGIVANENVALLSKHSEVKETELKDNRKTVRESLHEKKLSDDENEDSFFDKGSVHGTEAYQILLGKVPAASKVAAPVENSSESSDDIENAFFTSVMASTPISRNEPEDGNNTAQVKDSKKANGRSKRGGESQKVVSAEDRQRIAKKVMHLGSSSDSDVNLPTAKDESDSDDFFS